MSANIRHDDSPIAEPGVRADGHVRPFARLLADGDIKAIRAMLFRSVGNGDVRSDQDVVPQRDLPKATEDADVGVAANRATRVGKHGAETDARSAAATP